MNIEVPYTTEIPATLDENDPTSLINTAPEPMVPVLRTIRDTMPKMVFCSEKELRVKCSVDDRDDRARLAFWDEYDRATAQGRRMSMRNLIKGVCTLEVWNGFYFKRKLKMLWIICPPRNYAITMRSILDRALERVQEALELPIKDGKGQVDTKLLAQIVKIAQMADLRVTGAITQRLQIQQHSLNVNADMAQLSPSEQAILGQIQGMDLEQLEVMEKKLSLIESRATRQIDATEAAKVVDVGEKTDIDEGQIPQEG